MLLILYLSNLRAKGARSRDTPYDAHACSFLTG
jgi:hypothetical protein